jgi:tetratricopeptide (TPR) repeat protein
MKKILILILCLSTFSNLYSQSIYSDYFEGKKTYCPKPTDERSRHIYDLGIECVQRNKRLGEAFEFFAEIIKKDNNFCDAYFWAGYTLRLSNMNKDAVIFFAAADSLAQNKSFEFKQNLATTSMLIGADKYARKKFEELTEYFPTSPEGFYGIALTSTTIGDFDYGLKNISIAEKKYKSQNKDAQFLKAVLLTLNGNYKESITYYEKCSKKFENNDNFNGNYALSLYKVGTNSNDKKMLKEAKKYYRKVNNKSLLTEDIKAVFE